MTPLIKLYLQTPDTKSLVFKTANFLLGFEFLFIGFTGLLTTMLKHWTSNIDSLT